MKIAINVSALGDDLDLSPFEKLGECKFFGDISEKNCLNYAPTRTR